ncbi:hybrid sensor histidine kinase/response regulator [Desulfogranum mediterraneum]|uniref:hybrid sensor histidine kinase/response regulator n=1 Tax=Desulfogranum mediterraneum TaxID=160661 RepID=UPI00048CC061|nr:response regulator [Desulfogranum mediterraneum]
MSGIGIRAKILLCFLLFVLLISGAFTLSSYSRITRAVGQEIQKHGVDLTATFTQLAAPYVFAYDYVTIRDIARQLIRESDLLSITIVDVDGRVWLSTESGRRFFPLGTEFYRTTIRGNLPASRYLGDQGSETVEFVCPITALGKVTHLVITRISLATIHEEAAQRIRESILISGIMILLSGLIALYGSRRLTQPLKNLLRGTQEIASGNYAYTVPRSSSREFEELSRAFNLMSSRLAAESANRQQAEEQLLRYQENLEQLVSERTGELEQANQRLSGEINEHRKTEAALKKSEQRYKRLSEVAVEGIVLHRHDRIIDCNATFEKQFGYTVTDLRDQPLAERLFPREFRAAGRQSLQEEGGLLEGSGRHRDGSLFPLRLQSLGIASAHDELRVTSILDVTEQKKMEARIQQTQRLESIGLMAGGVAHDLNNILAGIVGYPQLLLWKLAADSELRSPLEAIQEAGERAGAVVADLLTLARGAASVREPHSLNTLVREYLASPEFQQLSRDFPQVCCQHDLGAKESILLCSPVHIKKCLMNLVNNGAEAIEGSGTITITTSNRYIGTSSSSCPELAQGEYLLLRVEDTGPGIGGDAMERIFEPFYSKKVLGRSGTGLGLTVVWNTVEDHGGTILVESGDQGSCFQLFFPLSSKRAVSPEQGRQQQELLLGHGEQLLVVDDDAMVRDLAAKILEHQGYRVVSVASGEEAVAHIRQQPVDLVILDMLMPPGMNGYQTYREICRLYPGQKAIIASGFSESRDVRAALDLGADRFVKKPYTMEHLALAVKEALYGSGEPW